MARNSTEALAKKKETYFKNRARRSRHGKHWTPAEDRKLTKIWESNQRLIESAFRDRSWKSICTRAFVLGLRFGAPQGHEFLNAAARRTGLSRSKLVEIFRARGTSMYRSRSQMSRSKPSHWVYVEISDTDDCVEWYLSLTTVTSFAREKSIDRTGFSRRVQESGIKPKFVGPRDIRYEIDDLEHVYELQRFTLDQITTVQRKQFVAAYGHTKLQDLWKIVPKLSTGQIYRLAFTQNVSMPPKGFDRFSTFCLRARIREDHDEARSMIMSAPKEYWWRAPDLPWRFHDKGAKVRPEEYSGDGWSKFLYVNTTAFIEWAWGSSGQLKEKSA